MNDFICRIILWLSTVLIVTSWVTGLIAPSPAPAGEFPETSIQQRVSTR